MDLERSLPLDLDHYPQAVSCLLERFSREQDSVVRAKIACLLGQLGKAPGLKVNDLADNIIRMLKTDGMSSLLLLCTGTYIDTCIGTYIDTYIGTNIGRRRHRIVVEDRSVAPV